MSSLSSSAVWHPYGSSPPSLGSVYSRETQTILVLTQSKPPGTWIIRLQWNSRQTKYWILSVLLGSCVSLSKPPNLSAFTERVDQSAKSFWGQDSAMFPPLFSLLLSSALPLFLPFPFLTSYLLPSLTSPSLLSSFSLCFPLYFLVLPIPSFFLPSYPLLLCHLRLAL